MEDEFDNVNIYEFFGVEITADTKLIEKKYRKASLTCHPDLFPNDDKKADQFMKLKRAKDLLCDPTKRKTYDAKQRVKQLHQKRKNDSSEKSKLYREKLEEKEREFKKQKIQEEDAKLKKNEDVVSAREMAMKKIAEKKEKNKTVLKTNVVIVDKQTQNEKEFVRELKVHTMESYQDMVKTHNDLEAQILAQMMGT